MKYAHIYKSRRPGWYDLYLTDGASICGACVFGSYANKAQAKQAASNYGAKPWNY